MLRSVWWNRTLGGLVIFLGAVGLASSLAVGVLLYLVGESLNETWGVANEGLKQTSQVLTASSRGVDASEETVARLEEGLVTTGAAFDSIVEGVGNAQEVVVDTSDTLGSLGSALDSAGDSANALAELEPLSDQLQRAGGLSHNAAQGLDSLEPVFEDLRVQSLSINESLQDAGAQLPEVRRGLSDVSQELDRTAASLNTIADNLEELRQSGLLKWVLITGWAYSSALSLAFVLFGVFLVTTAASLAPTPVADRFDPGPAS